MIDVPSPDCPRCGQPPQLQIGDSQAFCGNEECDVLMWNPRETREVLEANERRINLETGETS